MKKLYALLAAMTVTAAANAALWLVGDPAGGWNPQTGIQMTETSTNVYEIEVSLTKATSYFAFVDQLGTSGSDWNTFNAHRYGPSSNNTPAKEGTNAMIYGQDRSFMISAGDYKFSVNTATKILTVSGKVEDPTPDLYIIGEMNGWAQTNASWHFTTTDNKTFTFTTATFPNSSFKIGGNDWFYSFSTENTSMEVDTEYTCVSGGMDNNMAFAGEVTNCTITFNIETMTFKATGTIGEPGEKDYSAWYVNIIGPFNGWGDNGVNPVNGISTTKDLNIGTEGFKVKIWYAGGPSDGTYYITGSDEPIALDTWVKLSVDGSDGPRVYIADATAESVYDVQYNCATNEVYVTLAGSIEPEPYPETLYIIGDKIVADSWNLTSPVAMNNDGDGFFSIEKLDINPTDGGTVAYVSFCTQPAPEAGDDAWNQLGTRYGAASNNFPAESDEEYDIQKGDNAFVVEPGQYTINVSFEDMIVVFEKTGMSGVESVVTEEAPAVYYNLQGVRVANPAAGQLVIKQQGTTVTKVLVK